MEQNPLFVFIHIPKTGGTTIFRHIHPLFANECKLSRYLYREAESVGEFLKLSLHEKNRYDFIGGHIRPSLHHYVTRPCLYFTFLRNSLDHHISLYHHIISDKSHHLHGKLADEEITLEMFLTRDDIPGIYHQNTQTKCLWNTNKVADGELVYEYDLPATSDMLTQAKQVLRDQFFFVGLTERFTDSLCLLQTKLNFKPAYYRSHRVAMSRSKYLNRLNPDVIIQFKKINWADIALYRYGEQLFNQQFNELGTSKKWQMYMYRYRQYFHEQIIKRSSRYKALFAKR